MSEDYDHRYTPVEIIDLRERVSIFQALSDALERWPEVSRLVFEAEMRSDVVEQMAHLLGVTETVAAAVGEMQLMRASKDGRSKIRLQLDESKAQLAQALAQRDD